MTNTSQAGFYATDDNRNVFVGFFTTLCVNSNRAVGAFSANVTGGVGIIMTQFFIRGVAVYHRIHVAGSHTKIQIWLAQLHEVIFGMPIRLGNNPYAKAV